MFATLKTTSSSRHLLPILFIFCCCYRAFSNFGDAAIVPLSALGRYKVSLGELNELLTEQQRSADAVPSTGDKLPNYAKIPYGAKHEDKRREFEHGWEQCEFSPISCMLRRRKR